MKRRITNIITTVILFLLCGVFTTGAQTVPVDISKLYHLDYAGGKLRIGQMFDSGKFQIAINNLGALRMDSPLGHMDIVLANSSKAYLSGGNFVFRVDFKNPETNIYSALKVGTVFTNSNPPRVEIEDIPDQYAKGVISSLHPVTYQFSKEAASDEKRHYGFVAQEFEEVLPNLVKTADGDIKTIDLYSVIPLLVSEINSLKSEIDGQMALLDAVSDSKLIEEDYIRVLTANHSEIDLLYKTSYSNSELRLVDTSGNNIAIQKLDDSNGRVTVKSPTVTDGVVLAVIIKDGKTIASSTIHLNK